MKETIFTGAAVALVTPFNPDMSVNYEELEKLIEFQITSGTDAIVICGTTGEAATLTDEEHIATIGTAVKAAAGRVPVVPAGVRRGVPAGRGRRSAGQSVLLPVAAPLHL